MNIASVIFRSSSDGILPPEKLYYEFKNEEY
jgi:hypothetical protein